MGKLGNISSLDNLLADPTLPDKIINGLAIVSLAGAGLEVAARRTYDFYKIQKFIGPAIPQGIGRLSRSPLFNILGFCSLIGRSGKALDDFRETGYYSHLWNCAGSFLGAASLMPFPRPVKATAGMIGLGCDLVYALTQPGHVSSETLLLQGLLILVFGANKKNGQALYDYFKFRSQNRVTYHIPQRTTPIIGNDLDGVFPYKTMTTYDEYVTKGEIRYTVTHLLQSLRRLPRYGFCDLDALYMASRLRKKGISDAKILFIESRWPFGLRQRHSIWHTGKVEAEFTGGYHTVAVYGREGLVIDPHSLLKGPLPLQRYLDLSFPGQRVTTYQLTSRQARRYILQYNPKVEELITNYPHRYPEFFPKTNGGGLKPIKF